MNQLASTACTPRTGITPSAAPSAAVSQEHQDRVARGRTHELDAALRGQVARSASVFNWMKVSVPWVNQLIWPGAVNAMVRMNVKSW